MLILLILICIGLIWADRIKFDSNDAVTIAGGFGLLVITLALLNSTIRHADDLGTIRTGQETVDVLQTRVVELQKNLREVAAVVNAGADNSTITLNADAPMKTLAEEIATATTDLARSRATIAQAKISIAQRQAGPFWIVPAFYGKR